MRPIFAFLVGAAAVSFTSTTWAGNPGGGSGSGSSASNIRSSSSSSSSPAMSRALVPVTTNMKSTNLSQPGALKTVSITTWSTAGKSNVITTVAKPSGGTNTRNTSVHLATAGGRTTAATYTVKKPNEGWGRTHNVNQGKKAK